MSTPTPTPTLNSAFAHLSASPRMPVVFVGHGNPMHGIEDNAYSRSWRALGAALPRPAAVLCVSAHWLTRGTTLVHVGTAPATIHDFGGFPPELYAQQYPAPGAPDVARAAAAMVRSVPMGTDTEWGLDHGAWTVLRHMYPQADIPVFQMSLDIGRSPAALFDLARELKPLRDRGVLILGSGNLVHNLRALAPGAPPYDWARDFDAAVARAIEARDFAAVTQALSWGQAARLSHPTPDHFLPALFPLGAAGTDEPLTFFNASFDLGSIAMRSFVLGGSGIAG